MFLHFTRLIGFIILALRDSSPMFLLRVVGRPHMARITGAQAQAHAQAARGLVRSSLHRLPVAACAALFGVRMQLLPRRMA